MLSGKQKHMLHGALRARKARLENQPPADVPWSLFDTAQAHLMLGDESSCQHRRRHPQLATTTSPRRGEHR
jgi:hypothetical protein